MRVSNSERKAFQCLFKKSYIVQMLDNLAQIFLVRKLECALNRRFQLLSKDLYFKKSLHIANSMQVGN